MRHCLILLILIGSMTGQALCQVDLQMYMNENPLPFLFLRLDDYRKVEFKWNMKGTIQAELNDGINNLDEGNPSLAIGNFNKVIAMDSNFWVTYYYRGIAFKIQRNFNLALVDLKKCTRLNPSQAEAHLEMGEVFQIASHYDEAKEEFEKAVDLDPSLVQGHYSLGTLSMSKRDYAQGKRYFEKCNKIDPKFPASYTMEGFLKYRANDFKGSISLYDKAIWADSTFSQAYFWRGLSNYNLNKMELCLADWNRVVRFNPSNSYYLLMRGFLLTDLQKFDEAFIDLRKALRGKEINEDKFDGAQTLLDKQIDLQFAANYVISTGYGLDEKAFGFVKKGFCLLLAGKMNDALESLKEAEKFGPSSTVFFLLAVTYEHRNEHQQAYQYYNKALALDNDIFDAHKKRAVYRYEIKDWKGAHADLNAMFRLQPESPATYRLRGLIRSNERNFRGAIEDLDTFIKVDSSDAEAYRTRAVCKQMLGDGHGANDDFRRMIRTRPEDWKLYADVANNYIILKDTSAAIEVWELYVKARPTLNYPYMKLGELFAAQHKWEALKKIVQEVQPLTPERLMNDRSIIFYWQALVFIFEKMDDAALEELSKALKANKNNHTAKYTRAKLLIKKGENGKAAADLKDLAKIKYLDSEALYASMSRK